MAETLPWRERILIRLYDLTAAISGIATVKRTDTRGCELNWNPGTTEYEALVLDLGDEVAGEDMQDQTAERILTAQIEVLVGQPADATENTAFLHNRWAAKLEKAILGDPYLIDPGPPAVPLAMRAWLSAIMPPEASENGGIFVTLEFKVRYRHDFADPYTQAGSSRSYAALPDACRYPFA